MPGDVKAKVLVLHGANDPYAPAEQVVAFEKEFTAAKADWQLVLYGGAVHAFTQKEAGNDNSKGAAYNEPADRRSWAATQTFWLSDREESRQLSGNRGWHACPLDAPCVGDQHQRPRRKCRQRLMGKQH